MQNSPPAPRGGSGEKEGTVRRLWPVSHHPRVRLRNLRSVTSHQPDFQFTAVTSRKVPALILDYKYLYFLFPLETRPSSLPSSLTVLYPPSPPPLRSSTTLASPQQVLDALTTPSRAPSRAPGLRDQEVSLDMPLPLTTTRRCLKIGRHGGPVPPSPCRQGIP